VRVRREFEASSRDLEGLEVFWVVCAAYEMLEFSLVIVTVSHSVRYRHSFCFNVPTLNTSSLIRRRSLLLLYLCQS